MFYLSRDKLKTENTFNLKMSSRVPKFTRDLSNTILRLIGKNLSAGRRH